MGALLCCEAAQVRTHSAEEGILTVEAEFARYRLSKQSRRLGMVVMCVMVFSVILYGTFKFNLPSAVYIIATMSSLIVLSSIAYQFLRLFLRRSKLPDRVQFLLEQKKLNGAEIFYELARRGGQDIDEVVKVLEAFGFYVTNNYVGGDEGEWLFWVSHHALRGFLPSVPALPDMESMNHTQFQVEPGPIRVIRVYNIATERVAQ
jgi:hypothetical protein